MSGQKVTNGVKRTVILTVENDLMLRQLQAQYVLLGGKSTFNFALNQLLARARELAAEGIR